MPVARSRFCRWVNRDDDGLDVLSARMWSRSSWIALRKPEKLTVNEKRTFWPACPPLEPKPLGARSGRHPGSEMGNAGRRS